MDTSEQKRFDTLYRKHLQALKLQGLSDMTIDSYARALRRLVSHFDCCPDQLSVEQLKTYFAALVASHSWSTVKVDRCGLQFFWKHVLGREWAWVDIVKPPRLRSLPVVLSIHEVERLIVAAKHLRFRTFVLATYSMGLRLSETLALEVGDIDADRHRVHIRRGKGHKDRLVYLPERTLQALRVLWRKHRNPRLLFPSATGTLSRIQQATRPMDRGSTQVAVKRMLADAGIKKKPPCIPCATVLPPICSKPGSICVPSRNCSAMPARSPQPAIPNSARRLKAIPGSSSIA